MPRVLSLSKVTHQTRNKKIINLEVSSNSSHIVVSSLKSESSLNYCLFNSIETVEFVTKEELSHTMYKVQASSM